MRLGRVQTIEEKNKISNSVRNWWVKNKDTEKIVLRNKKISIALKGKSYEEIYGKEKADMLRKLRSMHATNRKVSEETCLKLRKPHPSICGDKNSSKRLDVRMKISKKLKGRQLTQEWKDKISKTLTGRKCPGHSIIMAQKFINGDFNLQGVQYKIGHFFSQKNNKNLYYRSSYELTAYQILESMTKVIKYETEPFRIEYNWNNSIHNYVVDILVYYDDGIKELIEIKPIYKLENRLIKYKIEAGKNYASENNMRFSIWTEKELFS